MEPWPLVGRNEELALLHRLVVDEGRGVVVVAPPGTGKTRLLSEAIRRAGAVVATERVVGTRSAQSLPLGAVEALLPVSTPAAAEPLDLFRAVRRTLAERGGAGRLVIAIDDAHLLDPQSAALVHHLAITDGIPLLVAVRAGAPVEDAITALWRDDIAERVDLQPLGRDDVSALLRAVLGGDVDAATAWRFWHTAGGNPLYLREVVSEALRVQTLSAAGGVWRWQGELHVGARLRELVELRLSVLDDAERVAVDLLAVGEHLTPDVVEAICEPRHLAGLRRRGFVVSGERDGRVVLELDHPVFAETVRGSMSATERARWCRFLAETVDPSTGDDGALLQHALWQIDGGVATDAEALTHAAERANARFDGALGERLARAAQAAGGGDEALLVLGEACLIRGHYEEALVHVASLESIDLRDDLLARLATLLAQAGFWGVGRIAETSEGLEHIAARVQHTAARQRVLALQSAVMLAGGKLAAASELGLSIAADADADPQARLRAVTAGAAGLSLHGHPEAALQLCEDLLPLGFAHAAVLPRGVGFVLAQALTALTCIGRFEEATLLLAPARDAAIAEGDDEVVSSSSLVLGRLLLARGDLVGAAEMLRQAAAALRVYDPSGYLPWCLGVIAQVAGQRGDHTTARAAMRELDGDAWFVRLYDHEVMAGRAWALAVEGELTAPLRILLDAAADARSAGSLVTEGMLLHEALRLGAPARDVVDRLEATCATGGLPYHRTFLAHAAALGNDDGPALDAVTDAFEATGFLLFAAESTVEAASAYRRAGQAARATRSGGRAIRLRAGCPGARTPALAGVSVEADLTRREREVSGLAAAGRSNSAIAAQLGVGVRTVEGHLLRAMTKLGVNNRHELAEVLDGGENA